jgi:hypothetical protein
MAHLEANKAPIQELPPQEQKRVSAMVDRIWQQNKQPAWVVWTAISHFAPMPIWQLQPKKEDTSWNTHD